MGNALLIVVHFPDRSDGRLELLLAYHRGFHSNQLLPYWRDHDSGLLRSLFHDNRHCHFPHRGHFVRPRHVVISSDDKL